MTTNSKDEKTTLETASDQDIKNAISGICEGLFESLNKDKRENTLYPCLIEHQSKLVNPREINQKFVRYYKDIIQVAIKDSINIPKQHKGIFTHISLNYDYYYNNIIGMTTILEGHCCCTDRAKFIMQEVIYYFKNDNFRNFENIYSNFSAPKQPIESWKDFVLSLFDFYYGNPKKYSQAIQNLSSLTTQ